MMFAIVLRTTENYHKESVDKSGFTKLRISSQSNREKPFNVVL